MINKLLIANRGEIACRIIETCRRLKIATVSIYTDSDSQSKHVYLADEAYKIGKNSSSSSYLNMSSIIELALLTGCDAIHPGYGFLSENAEFSKLCTDNGLIFIGPKTESILSMGNKASARNLAVELGIPVVPGKSGEISTVQQAVMAATEIGFPVLLKSALGGGGKGIRECKNASEVTKQFSLVQQEAEGSFNSKSVYIEKKISKFQHIEVQIISDGSSVLVLGERNCTLQRARQKVVEETPCPLLPSFIAKMMEENAVKICKKLGYLSAGTVEFIYDIIERKYYFLEMNTRIQVEHGISEAVSGIDIVEEQLRIADGKLLSRTQEQTVLKGVAIEVRVNAEEPLKHFYGTSGVVDLFHIPNTLHTRVDTFIYSGFKVQINYDPMLAKLMVYGHSRVEAIRILDEILDESEIVGLRTNLDLLRLIVRSNCFLSGKYSNLDMPIILKELAK